MNQPDPQLEHFYRKAIDDQSRRRRSWPYSRRVLVVLLAFLAGYGIGRLPGDPFAIACGLIVGVVAAALSETRWFQ